jgi:hypothetical protein
MEPEMTTFETKEAARQQRIVERAERAADRAREKTLSRLKVRSLTPTQYRHALKKLDITIVGAAPYFGISRRQAQRIAAEGPIPKLIEKVLELLAEGKLKKEDLL